MNIVLIGMRGSGKTTVGHLVSQKTKRKFFETDDLIEKKAHMKISQIVEKYDWNYFRQIEKKIVKKVANEKKVIISTGGGVILDSDNISLLKKSGFLVYLYGKIDKLIKRIRTDKNRPFLTKAKSIREDMIKTFSERKEIYKNVSDFTVDTNRKSETQVANEIINYLENRNLL